MERKFDDTRWSSYVSIYIVEKKKATKPCKQQRIAGMRTPCDELYFETEKAVDEGIKPLSFGTFFISLYLSTSRKLTLFHKLTGFESCP